MIGPIIIFSPITKPQFKIFCQCAHMKGSLLVLLLCAFIAVCYASKEDITNTYVNTTRPESATMARWFFSGISASIMCVCAFIAIKYIFT